MKRRGICPNKLSLVKRLARTKQYRFERTSTLSRALSELDFEIDDIISAIQKLRPEHRYDSRPASGHPECTYDYYKCNNLHLGKDVYLHFYILNNELVIDSCHRPK